MDIHDIDPVLAADLGAIVIALSIGVGLGLWGLIRDFVHKLPRGHD